MTPKNVTDVNGAGEKSATSSVLMESQALRTNIQNISSILNTGLSAESLDVCVRLCEAGVSPHVLARIISQIRTQMNTQSSRGL